MGRNLVAIWPLFGRHFVAICYSWPVYNSGTGRSTVTWAHRHTAGHGLAVLQRPLCGRYLVAIWSLLTTIWSIWLLSECYFAAI